MKDTLSLTFIVFTLAWCTSSWCEENKLDPGIINGWMRSAETSDSDKTEIKRIVHSTTMSEWMSSRLSFHVRYEVTNSDCQRTLTFYRTDEHGHSWDEEWVTQIEHDEQRESSQLEKPMVLLRAYNRLEGHSPVMKLKVEYQIHDGLPALVISDQRDVVRTLRAFEQGETASIRMDAFEHDHQFHIDLDGFADKVGWSNEHCPLGTTENSSNQEEPAS